uniref:Uncharacterized protein n=1 Tax=Parastrongyloides trichosuri TaxID=131310 RepID=A0A0N4ZTG7_PARTI
MEYYNPLFDNHLRGYLEKPCMRRHLKFLGLDDGENVSSKNAVYARHQHMMSLLNRNKERHLAQLSDLTKKLEAVEKVETYRRIRNNSILKNPHVRTLKRPMTSHDRAVIERIESNYKNSDEMKQRYKNVYEKLFSQSDKYNYLHKLDDLTLAEYKESLKNQVIKMEKIRDLTPWGSNAASKQMNPTETSWFFKPKSLPNLTHSFTRSEGRFPVKSLARENKPTANRQYNESNNLFGNRKLQNVVEGSRLPPLARYPRKQKPNYMAQKLAPKNSKFPSLTKKIGDGNKKEPDILILDENGKKEKIVDEIEHKDELDKEIVKRDTENISIQQEEDIKVNENEIQENMNDEKLNDLVEEENLVNENDNIEAKQLNLNDEKDENAEDGVDNEIDEEESENDDSSSDEDETNSEVSDNESAQEEHDDKKSELELKSSQSIDSSKQHEGVAFEIPLDENIDNDEKDNHDTESSKASSKEYNNESDVEQNDNEDTIIYNDYNKGSQENISFEVPLNENISESPKESVTFEIPKDNNDDENDIESEKETTASEVPINDDRDSIKSEKESVTSEVPTNDDRDSIKSEKESVTSEVPINDDRDSIKSEKESIAFEIPINDDRDSIKSEKESVSFEIPINDGRSINEPEKVAFEIPLIEKGNNDKSESEHENVAFEIPLDNNNDEDKQENTTLNDSLNNNDSDDKNKNDVFEVDLNDKNESEEENLENNKNFDNEMKINKSEEKHDSDEDSVIEFHNSFIIKNNSNNTFTSVDPDEDLIDLNSPNKSDHKNENIESNSSIELTHHDETNEEDLVENVPAFSNRNSYDDNAPGISSEEKDTTSPDNLETEKKLEETINYTPRSTDEVNDDETDDNESISEKKESPKNNTFKVDNDNIYISPSIKIQSPSEAGDMIEN